MSSRSRHLSVPFGQYFALPVGPFESGDEAGQLLALLRIGGRRERQRVLEETNLARDIVGQPRPIKARRLLGVLGGGRDHPFVGARRQDLSVVGDVRRLHPARARRFVCEREKSRLGLCDERLCLRGGAGFPDGGRTRSSRRLFTRHGGLRGGRRAGADQQRHDESSETSLHFSLRLPAAGIVRGPESGNGNGKRETKGMRDPKGLGSPSLSPRAGERAGVRGGRSGTPAATERAGPLTLPSPPAGGEGLRSRSSPSIAQSRSLRPSPLRPSALAQRLLAQRPALSAYFRRPFLSRIHPSIRWSRMSRGSAPAPRISSWKARMSKADPSSFFARSRSSRIFSWPIL